MSVGNKNQYRVQNFVTRNVPTWQNLPAAAVFFLRELFSGKDWEKNIYKMRGPFSHFSQAKTAKVHRFQCRQLFSPAAAEQHTHTYNNKDLFFFFSSSPPLFQLMDFSVSHTHIHTHTISSFLYHTHTHTHHKVFIGLPSISLHLVSLCIFNWWR